MERRTILWSAAVLLAGALASACGSSATLASQLAPSSDVTVTSLTIAVNTPAIGSTIPATAVARFSNGASSAVTTGFGTDTPAVATATSSGSITGVSVGDVTIFVDFQGMHASKKVHVLPNYAGTFVGTYAVSSCVQTGDFATNPDFDFCSLFTSGLVAPIAVQSTQSQDLTSLTGVFALGAVTGNSAGTISPTGVLSYAGSLVGGTKRMDFSDFTATSPSAGRITGSFTQVWTDSTITGQGVVTCTNLDMSQTSATAAGMVSPMTVRSSSVNGIARKILR